MKHVIPVMVRQGGGSIINISSVASIRHLGVFLCHLRHDQGRDEPDDAHHRGRIRANNIRVNAILPGLMKTPMVEHSAGLAASYAKGDVEAMWRARDAQVPMGHMGDAWDVANAALFLASDESRYVTGIELVVDGGITLKVELISSCEPGLTRGCSMQALASMHFEIHRCKAHCGRRPCCGDAVCTFCGRITAHGARRRRGTGRRFAGRSRALRRGGGGQ